MSLVDILLDGQNSDLLAQLANKAGIDEVTAKNLVTQLAPAVSSGIKQNATSQQGLDGLINSVSDPKLQDFVNQPERLSSPEAVDQGNVILSQVFGDKDTSRQVAGQAADVAGVDPGIVKQLLPLVATMIMGTLGKQASGADATSRLDGQQSSGLQSAIFSMLDADNDGDVTDDLINIAKKFF